MAKKLIIGFLLAFLLSNMIMLRGQNKFFDGSKAHHTKIGFTNPYLAKEFEKKKFTDLFKMMTEDRPDPEFKESKKVDRKLLIEHINSKTDFITWVGHSTLLVHIKGKLILTDPIFSDRCAPVQFAGPKRYTSPAISIDSLPPIDIIVISHNHFDHLDRNTVGALKKNQSTKWFVPLGLKIWFEGMGVVNVFELDWYENHSFSGVNVTCLPSQHWSKRTLMKSFDTLWASWSIEIGGFRFWFAGDTGYNSVQFKEIGEKYGPFDISAIPIGAYEPRWFMKNYHVNPEESLKIHADIKSKKTIGIHFGTFILTTEPVNEPEEKVSKLLEANDVSGEEFIVPKHGEIYFP